MTRNEYAKKVRRLEIFSSLFMTIGALVCILFGLGYVSLLIILGIFIGFQVPSYSMMKKCACPKCGNVDVFEKSRGFTKACKKNCPACRTKLNPDQPIKMITPGGK